MSKIVISGYYGFNNAGDEALLTAILAALRAVEPKADITVISGNPGNTIAKHQVKSMYRFAAVRLLRAISEVTIIKFYQQLYQSLLNLKVVLILTALLELQGIWMLCENG